MPSERWARKSQRWTGRIGSYSPSPLPRKRVWDPDLPSYALRTVFVLVVFQQHTVCSDEKRERKREICMFLVNRMANLVSVLIKTTLAKRAGAIPSAIVLAVDAGHVLSAHMSRVCNGTKSSSASLNHKISTQARNCTGTDSIPVLVDEGGLVLRAVNPDAGNVRRVEKKTNTK